VDTIPFEDIVENLVHQLVVQEVDKPDTSAVGVSYAKDAQESTAPLSGIRELHVQKPPPGIDRSGMQYSASAPEP